MSESHERVTLYFASIILSILFYVIVVVTIHAPVSNHLSSSDENTENNTSYENATRSDAMSTLLDLITRASDGSRSRGAPGLKRIRCATFKLKTL
jgi:hypothetical protein